MPVKQEAACAPKSLGTDSAEVWPRARELLGNAAPTPRQNQNLHFIQIPATHRLTSACEFQNPHLRAREMLTRSGQWDMSL